MWNSLLAIKKDFASLKYNLISSLSHFVSNIRLSRIDPDLCKKIHFGCGSDYKREWLNFDINKVADYWVDARNPIKLKDCSAELIYSSHLVEHLEHHELIFHLRECYRLLKSGGILRLGIPDFRTIIVKYNDNDFLKTHKNIVPGEKFGIPDDLICYMDLVNRAFYEFGQHKTALDFIKINNLLRFAGFNKEKIKQTTFKSEYDLIERKNATFYVEARK